MSANKKPAKKATRSIIIIAMLLLAAVLIANRYPLVRWFQIHRLSNLSCVDSNSACAKKIWVHRVNSAERYKTLHKQFAGYETDLVWDNNLKDFLVYHPPLTYKPQTLHQFLNDLPKHNDAFWYDVRSTVVADTTIMLNALQKLEVTNALKQTAILEMYDTLSANFFAEHGYQVALNINNSWIDNFKEADWRVLSSNISPAIKYVSQEDMHVPLLLQKFPDKKIITWSTSFRNYFDGSRLESLLQNKRIEVVLVNIKSGNYK